MCAWLKNASETENDSSTSRSRCSSEGPAEVEERQQEQHAQRQPDVQRVDVPAERAGIAARHRPRDLEAGPLFEHPAGGVGDDDLADLLLAAAREVADLPAERALQVGAAVGAGVFRAHGAHLRQRVRRSRARGSADSLRPAGGMSEARAPGSALRSSCVRRAWPSSAWLAVARGVVAPRGGARARSRGSRDASGERRRRAATQRARRATRSRRARRR